MEKKQNFHLQMEASIAAVDERLACGAPKPALLLHACCAPCSSAVLERLFPHFAVTIYYYNPNIHPKAEYERRLGELELFLERFPPARQHDIGLIQAEYEPDDFFSYTNVRNEPHLQTEPEKGERCRRCYELRMRRAWDYAQTHGFDYVTTTLSISPHKDAQKINDIGAALTAPGVCYLPADFKKKNGYLRSLQLSAEYGLYRQDYCGCVYSQQNKSL